MKTIINTFVLAAALAITPIAASAQTKISALPAASALTGTEQVPVVQSSATKATTPEQQRLFTMSAAASLATIKDTACAGIVAGTNVTKAADTSGHTCTISASGGSGGSGPSVSVHPGYRSTQWYRMGPYGIGNTTTSAGGLACEPFRIAEDVTWDAVSFTPNGTVAASPNYINIGVYTNSAGRPGTKLWETGQTDMGGTVAGVGVKVTLGTPRAMTAGIYWTCALTSAAQQMIGTTVDGALYWMLGSSDSAQSPVGGQGAWYNSTYGYTNGLPADTASAGLALANAGAPMIAFRKQ